MEYKENNTNEGVCKTKTESQYRKQTCGYQRGEDGDGRVKLGYEINRY